jgi:hypothetical protein
MRDTNPRERVQCEMRNTERRIDTHARPPPPPPTASGALAADRCACIRPDCPSHRREKGERHKCMDEGERKRGRERRRTHLTGRSAPSPAAAVSSAERRCSGERAQGKENRAECHRARRCRCGGKACRRRPPIFIFS